MDISINGPRVIFTLPFFGGIKINETVVNSWIVIVIVLIICLILTRKLEKIPRKRTQQLAEKLVMMLDNLVISTMGERNKKFSPYILTLMVFSVFGSLISLISLRSVTADINVTLTWALMTFVLIHANGIRTKKLSYFKGFAQPLPMLPLNIVSEIATPISMSFRHFGNIVAGMIITTLIYGALTAATSALFGIAVPVLAVGIPAFLSIYFDLFTGAIQAFIFAMLTMVFVSNANQPD